MKRREFITAAGVGGAATAVGANGAVGTAAAQEEEGPQEVPDWPEFVTEANEYSSGATEDLRGESEATVEVGAGDGLAFAPPAIWIDAGTTVTWEWTGEGGGHNVSSQEGEDFSSDVTDEAGFTFEHTFEQDGQINTYQCDPHAGQGMHGGVAVGEVPTTEVETGVITDPEELGVKIQEHYVGIGAVLMISVSLVFTFFVLKYGESPHAKGGD
ncbi:halocyanin domain-containing protein [Halalkalicoccus sp. GCM10025322]|uniref:halocyanin domain-containing protein n=1 Tax=Halalkalicoccus TaxID=332246 RepID=UPI002F96878D